VLEQPSSHYVGSDFGEDSSLLLSLFTSVIVVVVARSITRANAGIAQEGTYKKVNTVSFSCDAIVNSAEMAARAAYLCKASGLCWNR